MEDLVRCFLGGDRRALARAISAVENDHPHKRQLLQRLYRHTGRSYVVGVTGSPGAGKSMLIGALTRHLRREGFTVGIVAVDPTSPFSGGAILGDRVRMQDIARDAGVFMRSLATRGSLGGLTRNTRDILDVLDGFGLDVILVETVGVGQSEVDVSSLVHSTVVVLTPGAGDGLQAMKSGIMEVGDVFALNKADLAGADAARLEIEGALRIVHDGPGGWRPPLVKTAAVTGEGVASLWEALVRHRDFLVSTGKLAGLRKERLRRDIATLAGEHVRGLVMEKLAAGGGLEGELVRVADRELDPYTLAEEVLTDVAREVLVQNG